MHVQQRQQSVSAVPVGERDTQSRSREQHAAQEPAFAWQELALLTESKAAFLPIETHGLRGQPAFLGPRWRKTE